MALKPPSLHEQRSPRFSVVGDRRELLRSAAARRRRHCLRPSRAARGTPTMTSASASGVRVTSSRQLGMPQPEGAPIRVRLVGRGARVPHFAKGRRDETCASDEHTRRTKEKKGRISRTLLDVAVPRLEAFVSLNRHVRAERCKSATSPTRAGAPRRDTLVTLGGKRVSAGMRMMMLRCPSTALPAALHARLGGP